ncbi:MAG TPA: MFS transporter [Pirellulales bacterium]|nr:MFS transporter [Pirellulales bacterium]
MTHSSQTTAEDDAAPLPSPDRVLRLRELSSTQWKSGAAAWLGWLFDGLDMHLYTLVAAPFVAELLALPKDDLRVGYYSSWIQAAFLIGWALGGGFFGRLGDRIGRSRALMLTILTYATFTGLSFFAQSWRQLLVFRFLAALGIGGEWAVGAALLSETWPRHWRPWLAAVLQTGVNLGVMLATLVVFLLAAFPPRTVFLAGVLPALLVLWIRRAVPEPEEWHAAKARSRGAEPRIRDLFQGRVRRITVLTSLVCALSLTGHWAFMFWCSQHLRNLPEVLAWTDARRSEFVSQAMSLVMITSIAGNFLAAAIARRLGYRGTIALMCLGYFLSMLGAYVVPRGPESSFYWLAAIGPFQGVFALFSMYLPPLFPTLLRTTGAGFCFNIGRIAAAAGTVFFGLFSQVGDYRAALEHAGWLFLPAAIGALFLPEAADDRTVPAPSRGGSN